jgi:hypothetical protein
VRLPRLLASRPWLPYEDRVLLSFFKVALLVGFVALEGIVLLAIGRLLLR